MHERSTGRRVLNVQLLQVQFGRDSEINEEDGKERHRLATWGKACMMYSLNSQKLES